VIFKVQDNLKKKKKLVNKSKTVSAKEIAKKKRASRSGDCKAK
jgi:hypothetical protein